MYDLLDFHIKDVNKLKVDLMLAGGVLEMLKSPRNLKIIQKLEMFLYNLKWVMEVYVLELAL